MRQNALQTLLTEELDQDGTTIRSLADDLGVSFTRLAHWKTRGTKTNEIVCMLVRLRELRGESWTKFGKRLEELCDDDCR